MNTVEHLTRAIDVGLAALAEARATDGTISPARVIELGEQMRLSHEDAIDVALALARDRLFEVILRKDDGVVVDGTEADEILCRVASGAATREECEMEVLYRPRAEHL